MGVQVVLPQFGMDMSEGLLVQWLVSDGAEVREGEPLYELENEKSVQEVEAPASGRLKVIAAAGETYEVGALLGQID
jgi:pyruvate/2-oxoglutarate dehydrogenase complex dihydrolipoamide acyltransferase (E2) component